MSGLLAVVLVSMLHALQRHFINCRASNLAAHSSEAGETLALGATELRAEAAAGACPDSWIHSRRLHSTVAWWWGGTFEGPVKAPLLVEIVQGAKAILNLRTADADACDPPHRVGFGFLGLGFRVLGF